jgi:hypothetical protein
MQGTKVERRKLRGGETIQVTIHIYMEVSQWNSLCNYLKQIKMSFFNIGEQEGKTGPIWKLVPVGRGRL